MVLRAIGGLLIAFGTIWALQGLGLLNWPPESVMLAQREWVLYGALAAAIGAIAIIASGRLGRTND
jgi:hypothetical protein